MHLNANPTQGEILHEQYQEKKEALKETSKSRVLARYGGEEYLEKLPKELLNGQTEDYVEYSKSGAVVKGSERAKARSKYEEDGTCLRTGVTGHDNDWWLFSSVPREPYLGLGIMVRLEFRSMGFRVLPFDSIELILYWRRWD